MSDDGDADHIHAAAFWDAIEAAVARLAGSRTHVSNEEFGTIRASAVRELVALAWQQAVRKVGEEEARAIWEEFGKRAKGQRGRGKGTGGLASDRALLSLYDGFVRGEFRWVVRDLRSGTGKTAGTPLQQAAQMAFATMKPRPGVRVEAVEQRIKRLIAKRDSQA